MLNVLSGATPEVGRDPSVSAGVLDMDAVVGEWEVQWLLPFLWMGFVPEAWWPEYRERLVRALAAGEDVDTGDVADIVVAWPVAEQAFRTRVTTVTRVWPEFADPAARFLDDVGSVAARAEHPVVRLQLDQLVTMSVGDETELGRFVTDVMLDAAQWSEPNRSSEGRVSDFHRAAAAGEPQRSFLLAGDRTFGGPEVPRSASPEPPPSVSRPSYISPARWEGRYGMHGEDLWEDAATAAARKDLRDSSREAWPWYWAVILAIVFALVAWLIVGMVTDSMPWAIIGGVAVGALTIGGWRARVRALR